MRYAADLKAQGEEREKLLETIIDYTLKLNVALGYDFNTVEFAVRDGIPYAIDFCNPAPDADIYSVGRKLIFEWVVEAAANMAIERAKKQVPGQTNLTWGTFMSQAINGVPAPASCRNCSTGSRNYSTGQTSGTPQGQKRRFLQKAPKAKSPAPAKPAAVVEATPPATEVKVKAVTPKKATKTGKSRSKRHDFRNRNPKSQPKKAAATKAPAKNSKLKNPAN